MIWNKWINYCRNKFYQRHEKYTDQDKKKYTEIRNEAIKVKNETKKSSFSTMQEIDLPYLKLLALHKACEIGAYNQDKTIIKTGKERVEHTAFERYTAINSIDSMQEVIDIIKMHSAAKILLGKEAANNRLDPHQKQILNNPLASAIKMDSDIIQKYFKEFDFSDDRIYTKLDLLKHLAYIERNSDKQNSSSDSWILKNEKFNPGIQSSDGDSTDNSLKFPAIVGDFEIKQNHFD